MTNEVREPPLVSAVIPSVLRSGLHRVVACAREQQVAGGVEVVVVVDTDVSDEQRRELEGIADVVILTGGRRGAGVARNLGVRSATAPYVAFLDDDDEWCAGHLASAIDVLEDADDRADVVGARVCQTTPDGSTSGPVPRHLLRPDQDVLEYLFRGRRPDIARPSIYTSTLVARREVALRSPWREGLPRHQDWEWLRSVQASGHVVRQSAHLGARIQMGSVGSISATSDWRTSLEWGRSWRREASRAVYADFVAGQPLRYAMQARSSAGVRACVRELSSAGAWPSLGTLALGLGGALPRGVALRAVTLAARVRGPRGRRAGVLATAEGVSP
jgi:hypothetical protein